MDRVCRGEGPCAQRCRWVVLLTELLRENAELVTPFLRKWLETLRMFNPNYTDLLDFRDMIIRNGRPFVELWLDFPMHKLQEWVGVYNALGEREKLPDDELVQLKVFEGVQQRLDLALRSHDSVSNDEMLCARGPWLHAIPNLSRRLGDTVCQPMNSTARKSMEMPFTAMQQGIHIGGDWTIEEARYFLYRARIFSMEDGLRGIIRLCRTKLRGGVRLRSEDLGHLWTVTKEWNETVPWSDIFEKVIKSQVVKFDLAVSIVHRDVYGVERMWKNLSPQNKDLLIWRGTTGVMIWAAFRCENNYGIRGFVTEELKRIMAARSIVLPLPPAVAYEINKDELRVEDAEWCLKQRIILTMLHKHLPDSWVLSWIGYLALFIRLNGDPERLLGICPSIPEWSDTLMELVTDDLSWHIQLCDWLRPTVLLVVFLVCHPASINSVHGRRGLLWLTEKYRWWISEKVITLSMNRILEHLSDELLLHKDVLLFLMKTRGLKGLQERLLRASVEYWTPETLQVFWENADEKLRTAVVWGCLFRANIPSVVVRAAVNLRMTKRSEGLWQAVLRIHAILPNPNCAPRLASGAKLGALVRLGSDEGRTVRDLSDAIQVLLNNEDDVTKQWKMASDSNPTNAKSFVIGRLRRFCACVTFADADGDDAVLGQQTMDDLACFILYWPSSTSLGSIMWFLCKWGDDDALVKCVDFFLRHPHDKQALDSDAEAFGDCMSVLLQRLPWTDSKASIGSMWNFLNMHLVHPNAGVFPLPRDDLSMDGLWRNLDLHSCGILLQRLVDLRRFELLALFMSDGAGDNVRNAWKSSERLSENVRVIVEELLSRDRKYPEIFRIVKTSMVLPRLRTDGWEDLFLTLMTIYDPDVALSSLSAAINDVIGAAQLSWRRPVRVD